MAEGSTNKVSISDRDKKILYIVGGIVLLALAYFLGFQKMMASKNEVVQENIALQADVEKLVAMVANKAKVESETQEFKTNTENILVKYPPEVRTQDAIHQLDLLEKGVNGLVLQAESFTMNQVFFMNGALTEGEVQDVAAPAETSEASGEAVQGPIIGYRSGVTTNFTTNYDNLKEVIQFVNTNPNRMTINSITVSQGEGAKKLTCNMEVNMYAISGTEKEYKDPVIPEVRIGKGEKLFAEGDKN